MRRGALIFFAVLAVAAPAQEHTKDSLDTVKKALAAKKALLIDVREKSEWDQGHLKDAKLLPLSALKGKAADLEVLAKDKAVYLHCRSGGRCLQAAEILRKLGYDARPLKQGYQELLKSGF
jgi:rhodanese-related sulfurtransferase